MRTIKLIAGLLILMQTTTQAQDFKFEKIIFHAGYCLGNCPVYHLEVNSDTTMKLYAEAVFDNTAQQRFVRDSSKMGYFTGKATSIAFRYLVKELAAIHLDELTFDGVTCCDASVKEIIVYYNGKRKSLISMFPPVAASNLIQMLYALCENSVWQRCEKSFEIERDPRE